MNTNVGIVITTMDRAEFIKRQLEYYASANSPHTVYIGDSSNPEQVAKIEESIARFKNKIKIVYKFFPKTVGVQLCAQQMIDAITEKYFAIIGDDDFQIPSSLTKCAEFLENNPDYATAHGHAVAIRVKNNSVYGELSKIKDYPEPEIKNESAQDRIVNYLEHYYPTIFSVTRLEVIKEGYKYSDSITDKSFSSEMLPCALGIVAGKSKLIDCLSFVRQIHDGRYLLPDMYDWITQNDWSKEYQIFQEIMIRAIAKKDAIPEKQAQRALKKGFWTYLNIQMSREIYEVFPVDKKISMKNLIRQKFPFLIPLYKIVKPMFSKKRWLHAEVINPQSPYYQDFKAVKDSIEQIPK